MKNETATSVLRDRLGDDTTFAILQVAQSEQEMWSERMLSVATERYERRLAEEVAGLRVAVIREIHELHVQAMRWSFLFWLGQVAAVTAILGFMLRGR